MTRCPECGGSDLHSLGIERGERLDDEHAVLCSHYHCQSCGCELREIQVTSWRTEVIAHGCPEQLVLTEPEP